MTIGTDDLIEKFGTADTIHSTPGSISDAGFSAAGDVAQWTNDDDAPAAYFELRLKAAGLSGAPSLGATVSLFTRLMNLRAGADDSLAPQAGFEHLFLGAFPVDDQDADQNIVIGPIRLPNPETSQVHEFYLKNNMGVSTGTDWELYITPSTLGPHA
jgi:hypothetical protein